MSLSPSGRLPGAPWFRLGLGAGLLRITGGVGRQTLFAVRRLLAPAPAFLTTMPHAVAWVCSLALREEASQKYKIRVAANVVDCDFGCHAAPWATALLYLKLEPLISAIWGRILLCGQSDGFGTLRCLPGVGG